MSSIFNNTSTRIFCVSGELSDIFCLPNGWIVNFDELLSIRLRDLGFSGVVFCSTQRNMVYATDPAGVRAMSVLTGKKDPAPVKAPESTASSDDYSWLDDDAPAAPAPIPAPQKSEKLKYTHSIAKDQLSAATDRYMRDTEEPKAIVFTSLEDLIRLATTDEGRRLLERFEEWKSLPNENRNICIFLSKTLDSCGLQNMLHDNRVAVLESLFLRKNEFNRNSSLCIGTPLNDEIENLLEYLRIAGHRYTDPRGGENCAYLRFHRSDHSRIVRMLSFCSRDSGFTQLKSMKEIIERYMESEGTDEVWLTPDTVAALYPDSSAGIRDDTDPMQILREKRGWEPAYNVINSFISSWRMLYPDGAAVIERKELTTDRFEPVSDSSDRGSVPNFVLEGPPGVGKTAIANLIGRILQREGIIRSGHTVIGSRDKLVGEYVGSTAIRTAALIEEAQEGVLLVDEVYSIAEQGGENSISYCDEVFNTIVAAMTNKNYHFCVIFAGYADRMNEVWKMNEGLFSRFGASNIITLKEYEPPLLQSIFESQFGEPEGISGTRTVLSDDVKSGLPVFFENFFSDRDRKNFGNARDINNLVSDVKRAASYRRSCSGLTGDDVITAECCDFEAREALFEKRGFSAEDIYSKLHDYIGMEFLEDMFNDQLALRVECMEKGLAYPGPAHMIWAGNPGTGKSTAAQLTAELYHSLGILGSAEPIYVDASELTSVYVSGSAGKMNEKIDEACRKNAVLIIEEAYQLLEKGGEDAIHAMLNRMETDRANFNLILILYKNKVKEFLERNPGLSSRLRVYTFPDYDAAQLYEIFLLMCRKSRDEVSEECKAAAKEYIDDMYLSGNTSEGNARLIRQLTDTMKQRRYNRILSQIAEKNFGADTPENRKKAAAARAMGTVTVPADAYIFTADDLPHKEG